MLANEGDQMKTLKMSAALTGTIAIGLAFIGFSPWAQAQQRSQMEASAVSSSARQMTDAAIAFLATLTDAQREAVISAGDLLTQLESIDYLRRHRQLSVAEAHAALTAGLAALLA